MNINLHNYEAFFLDYHEGTLSVELVKELMEFLDRHPEFKEEFEGFEQVTLNDTSKIIFEEKEILKKHSGEITATNFDEYAISYIERTLPAEKQKELTAFIKRNTHFQKELEFYKKTKLTPDAIVFEDKASLKRKEGNRRVIWYWSTAASVALLIGAYFMLPKNEVLNNNNNIAQHAFVKDSNIVASKTINAKDTVASGKNIMTLPAIKRVKNNTAIAIKIEHRKQNKNTNNISVSSKDSSEVAIVKHENNNYAEPVKQPKSAPAFLRKDSVVVASNGHSIDTTSAKEPLIIVKAPQSELTVRRKGKFLIAIAKITCIGLHKVTGQHIELEEHYAADTTTIVAYQLDLGSKKFQFPVRE